MKKLLLIFSIFTITTLPAMAVECDDLFDILAQYCDDEGYRYNTNTVLGAKAYGSYTTYRDNVTIGCYEFKDTNHNEMKKATAKACKISENKVTIKTDLKRETNQVQCKDIDNNNGIKELQYIDGVCAPTECLTPRWKLSGKGKHAKCIEKECEFEHGTGKWEKDGDKWECKLTACDTAKGWKKNDAGNACIEMLDECTDEQKATHPNATKTGIKKGTETCIAQGCKCGYDLQNEKCVAWPIDENGKYKKPCDDNQLKKLNAKSGILYCENDTAKCEITACISDDYTHNIKNNTCDNKNKQPCTHGDKNATDAEYKKIDGKLTCFINDCRAGYKPNSDGTACTPQRVLSESDSQARINELKDNAQKMKAKEQSTANKLLGTAGIGATGIGGMQMASAMAEENADADAERAMRAYLATFHCNYGAGKNIAGGETNVELPGGNELINLYSEYVNLANDLKARKTALDMRPGIESESILDAATSGLYDDIAIGKTSGAYTSLARALMDPNGADAAAWAAQKAETADKKKTGMITAGIGAAGSLAGNLALNSGKDKQNKVDEILNKYEKLKQTFDAAQQEFDEIPAKKCSEFNGTTGTGNAPNCICKNPDTTRFFIDHGGCIPCEGGKVYDEYNQCKCPTDKPRLENGQCKEQIPSCQLTQLVKSDKCECIDNAIQDGQICKCNTDYIETDGVCVQDVDQPVEEPEPPVSPVTLDINSDTAFNSGYSTLTSQGQSALADLNQKLTTNKDVFADENYCITITGHTDRVPFKKAANKDNKKLSEERADTIKTELLKNKFIKAENIKTIGMGEKECTIREYPKENDERCRRVHIVFPRSLLILTHRPRGGVFYLNK